MVYSWTSVQCKLMGCVDAPNIDTCTQYIWAPHLILCCMEVFHLHYKDGLAFYIAGQCLEPYCVGNKLMIKTHPQNNTHYIMGHMAKNSRSLLYETTVSTVHFTCTQCQWPVWCGSLDSILMPNYDHQTTTSHILNPPCMYCTSDPECGTECGTECFTHAPRSHTAGSCGSNKKF